MMAKTKSPKNHLSTKINKLYFLLPIFFTILIALIYSQLVLVSQAESNSATFLFPTISNLPQASPCLLRGDDSNKHIEPIKLCPWVLNGLKMPLKDIHGLFRRLICRPFL